MIAQLDSLYLRIRPWKLWSRVVSYVLFEGRPLTTKGQWINPLVFALFSIAKNLIQMRPVKKPVFILGTGRSGTTILGMVLSMHREVGFLNEPKALWHSFHQEEDLIGSYSRGVVRYRLGADEATPVRIRDAQRLFGAYLMATFSRRVVDKYPELIFRVPFVKGIFPDAKFLFLVRNGWDTCHSIDGWSKRLGAQSGDEIHDWWGANRRKWYSLLEQLVIDHFDMAPYVDSMRTWTNQTDMAAVEWIVTMREGLRLVEQYPDDVLRVDYESLCVNPKQVLNDVVKFIDVDQDDHVLYKYAECTLRPITSKHPFPLHICIEKPFLDTMRQLGY